MSSFDKILGTKKPKKWYEMNYDGEIGDIKRDFTVGDLIHLRKKGLPSITKRQEKALEEIKERLYNWDDEPGFSDIFSKELSRDEGITVQTLKGLEEKGFIYLSKDDYYFKKEGYIVYPTLLIYLWWIEKTGELPSWAEYELENPKDNYLSAENIKDWSEQEMKSHGKDVSFKDFIKKEIKSHGNIDLVDWAKHEEKSHKERYGAENKSNTLDNKTHQKKYMDKKGMLHKLFREQNIPVKNVEQLRNLGKRVSGNGTEDYEIDLQGDVYNFSLVGTAVDEVGEGYFVLNEVEGANRKYYKGKPHIFDYSMEYEKPLKSLSKFSRLVYGNRKNAESFEAERRIGIPMKPIDEGREERIKSCVENAQENLKSVLTIRDYEGVSQQTRILSSSDFKSLRVALQELNAAIKMLNVKTMKDAETFEAQGYSFTEKLDKYEFKDDGDSYLITHGSGGTAFLISKDHFGGLYTIERFVEELNKNQEQAVSDVFNFLWNKTNNGYLDDILMNRAETFETQYAGVGSLMDIGKGTSIGSFSPEELTESSAIHGDFDSASLNYSGNQNIVSRAEGENMTESEESNFGSVGEGNNFGQMRAEEPKRLSKQGRYVAGYDGIIFDDENNGSMVLEDGGVWLEGSIGNEEYYGECDSCRNDLDGYETGYVVSGSWSICMECFDKMPGRKGVTIEMKNGEKRAEEPVIEEPDFIPDGDGRALGQQTSSINLSPLHAESKVLSKTNLVIAGVIGLGLWKGKQILDTAKSSLKQSAENKKKGCSTCNSNGTVRKNHTQVKQSEYSVNQINPVEAEGQNDIHGAEGVTNPRHAPSSQPFGYPSKSLKMW